MTGRTFLKVIAVASVIVGGPVTGTAITSAATNRPAGAGSTARADAALSWLVAGQNLANTRDQADEKAISASNVGTLVTDWSFTTDGDVSATPTVANGDVYFPDWGGELWALTDTGKLIWSHSVASYMGLAGDISRDSPAVHGNELILGDHLTVGKSPGAHVFAVNRTTGALLWSTLVDTNLAAIMTGSPTVYDGVVYVGISSQEQSLATRPGYKCCTFRGAVVALNATTGKLLWKTYMVPSNNGGGDSNKPGYYAGGAVWGSSPVVDPATGMLYVSTGDNYTVPSGICTRPGQKKCQKAIPSDYFDSITALNMTTGAVVWNYRTEQGDATTKACRTICGPDYDFGSEPNLFTTTIPGTHTTEQLVGAGQKSGIYWALNPATGKLVWKTTVGPGGGGGGMEWGTATDGTRVYCAEADTGDVPYKLGGSGTYAGETITSGSWAALDAATGKILWQTPDPQSVPDIGYVSTANGVVYAGSSTATGKNMYALDASTGAILWSFASRGEVRSGAAIVGPQVYWGTGYSGGEYDKFYAFGLPTFKHRG
jgi:polyvinyl alcohol dehydrogenase (cytochrome)